MQNRRMHELSLQRAARHDAFQPRLRPTKASRGPMVTNTAADTSSL
jgi:hypothetical protein